jgi:hypothetical protein
MKAVENISFSGMIQQPRNVAGEKKKKRKHKHKRTHISRSVAVEENFK